MHIFRNPSRTWALLSLGFYLFVAFIHNGPLQELGLPFIDPWTWIRQAYLIGPVGLHFYPLQLHPSPLLVHHYWERGPIRVTAKKLQVDDSMFMGWQLKTQRSSGVQTSDKLSGRINGAWHVSFFDWFLSRIEASLRLPCTFPIKTTPFSSHFSTFRRNTLSERIRHIC